jgi:uncharacterized protein with HEPN domain
VPPRDWRLRLEDILDAAEAILGYTSGMDYAAFCSDQRTVDAVIKNLAVMGEAANGIPEQTRRENPELPWEEMRDIRNVLIHEYFGTSLPILWQTITEDLPLLAEKLRAILKT